jgi:hypothetical protein
MLLTAAVACAVSGLTLIVTGVLGEADPRLSVTPLITLLTVLLALLSGTPSTGQGSVLAGNGLGEIETCRIVRHLDVARRAGVVAHQGKAVAIGVLNHAGRYSLPWLLMLVASWLIVLFVESTAMVTGEFEPT